MSWLLTWWFLHASWRSHKGHVQPKNNSAIFGLLTKCTFKLFVLTNQDMYLHMTHGLIPSLSDIIKSSYTFKAPPFSWKSHLKMLISFQITFICHYWRSAKVRALFPWIGMNANSICARAKISKISRVKIHARARKSGTFGKFAEALPGGVHKSLI